MFIAQLFIVVKSRNQSKCPSIDKWIKCGISTRYNGILPSNENKWSSDPCYNMNLKNIMLRARIQSQNTTCCIPSLIWNVQNGHWESRLVVPRTEEMGGLGDNRAIGHWGDKNILKIVVMVAQLHEYTKSHWGEKKKSSTLILRPWASLSLSFLNCKMGKLDFINVRKGLRVT